MKVFLRISNKRTDLADLSYCLTGNREIIVPEEILL